MAIEMRPRRTHLRAIWPLFVLVVFMFDWCSRSGADGLRPAYPDQLFQQSDLVVEMRIDEATQQNIAGRECGTKYTATILEAYKVGEYLTDAHIVVFGRYSGLHVGDRYFAFLKYESSAESVYSEMQSRPSFVEALRSSNDSKESVLALIRCNGIVPGLAAEPNYMWLVSGPEVIVPPDLLLQVPAGMQVDATDGTAYYLRASGLSAYLRDLGNKTN